MRALLLSAACGVLLGCAATAPPAPASAAATPAPEDAAVYYPLAPGWKWAYRVEKGGDTVLATYAVLERIAETAIVQAGEERLVYAVMPDGVARRQGLGVGDYLLRTPIRVGTVWPVTGGEAKVLAVGRTVTVPAGTFGGCATVEEGRSDPQRLVRTTYAAGVGPVTLELQVHDPVSGRFVIDTRAALLGVTRPGEDPLGAPEGTTVSPK